MTTKWKFHTDSIFDKYDDSVASIVFDTIRDCMNQDALRLKRHRAIDSLQFFTIDLVRIEDQMYEALRNAK